MRSTHSICLVFLFFKVSADFIEEANTMCEKHFGSTFGPRLVRGFNKEILFAVENSQSEEDEGITNLRNVIKTDASTNFPFVNEKFPLQWLHCEEEIIKYRQDPNSNMCIKLVKFKKLLEERCLVEFTDDKFNSMISFFHDTGLILLPGMLIRTLYAAISIKVVPRTREKVEYKRERLIEKDYCFIPEYITIHRFSTKVRIRSCFLMN